MELNLLVDLSESNGGPEPVLGEWREPQEEPAGASGTPAWRRKAVKRS